MKKILKKIMKCLIMNEYASMYDTTNDNNLILFFNFEIISKF